MTGVNGAAAFMGDAGGPVVVAGTLVREQIVPERPVSGPAGAGHPRERFEGPDRTVGALEGSKCPRGDLNPHAR